MIEDARVNKILYGGDYNPEQWPREVWEEDMRLLKLAHIDVLTLNVFNWAMLQPQEEVYDFEKLDEVMELVRAHGFRVFMATSTGAHPAWMARKYPDILRVQENGVRRKYGMRHNACPNSPTYRKYAAALVEKLAQRYADDDNIVGWHISNELGGICYCENCEKKFREWLKKKYKTLDALNAAWNTSFWSHTMYDWEDVVAPSLISEEFECNGLSTAFQGISLDYARFNSDSLLECYMLEKEILKKYTPNLPVSTNLMGMYKPLDYQRWSGELDFAGWDNYPEYDDQPAVVAMRHDLMRGLKRGKPFALLEQTPSVSNWHAICKLKRPGVMRLWSYQAVAHGADTVMFFQMRRSRGACEKLHGAVIDHAGHEHTRVFGEVAALGEELENKVKGLTLGARTDSKIAIVFDWDNWWASEFSAGPTSSINYPEEVAQYYKALFDLHVNVDIISVEEELSKYQLVIAPLFYMCKGKYDEKIRDYVKAGGAFLTTYFSGYVDEHDLIVTGGYPGRLRDILGVWVEEIDALPKEEANSFCYRGKTYPAYLACDLIHLEGARAISCYETDFYKGMPVLAENQFGKGRAYYVGTRSSEDFYKELLGEICKTLSIAPVIDAPEGVEATVRKNDRGEFLFLLNHTLGTVRLRMERAGTELLTGAHYEAGEELALNRAGVAIVQR